MSDIVIPKNTTTAALRRIPFSLVDSTDFSTPKDVAVTGVKVTLSFAGGTPASSTNDIVKVNGAAGEYYLELTQTEANTTLGYVRGWLTPTGCAQAKLGATIGPAEAYDSPVNVQTAVEASGGKLDTVYQGLAVAQGELTALPSITNSSLFDKMRYLFHAKRNKATATTTGRTLYRNDGSTTLGSGAMSDDGTTVTRSAET